MQRLAAPLIALDAMLGRVDAGIDERGAHGRTRVVEQEHPICWLRETPITMPETRIAAARAAQLLRPAGVGLHLRVDGEEGPVEVGVEVEECPALAERTLPTRSFPLRGDRGHFVVGETREIEALAFLDGEQAELGRERLNLPTNRHILASRSRRTKKRTRQRIGSNINSGEHQLGGIEEPIGLACARTITLPLSAAVELQVRAHRMAARCYIDG